jgi:hypothetical protein
MTEQEQIAHFLATRGATKCAVGERAMTEREMYLARRSDKRARASDPIQERHLAAVDHLGREYWVNGLGERIT